MAFKRIPPVYEQVSDVQHPEFVVQQTRVSDYLRKYGTGHADPTRMPQDTRPEVVDDRTPEEMLQDGFEPTLGTDELDIFEQIEQNKERWQKMSEDIELTKKQREQFDGAMKIINDPESSFKQREQAYEVLRELEEKGKVTRARN